MYYDTFDSGFGAMPSFDTGFGQPMFNGTGCFPTMSFDMGFNNGFAPSFTPELGMPMTCGYSPAPFGCNPVSMDFSGNVCIDGIPITPSTPPAWMTARAAQAEMHLNQLEMQLNDPNFWMNFIPQGAFNMPSFPTIDTSGVDWSALSANPISAPNPLDASFPMALDQMGGLMPSDGSGISNFGMPEVNAPIDSPMAQTRDEVLPCGLTQSQLDQATTKWESIIADYQSQIDRLEPGKNMAVRAMLQNHLHSAERHLRDLDKPLGTI